MALDYDYKTTVSEQLADIERTINSSNEYKIIMLNNEFPIGYIRIDWMDDHKDYAWLRFALGFERGNGFAFIALKQYIENLFKQGCHRIEGEVYDKNIASQKTLEKLGFIKEGIKRKAHYTGDIYIDVFVYGLIK
jgi:RimJ/RimL family protein N-acetyltransferase